MRGIFRRNWGPKVPAHQKIKHTHVAEARYTTLDSLEPLFATAKQEKLWFWNCSLNLWFSPSQLVAEHKRDRFIWGPDHWTLRNPREFQR